MSVSVICAIAFQLNQQMDSQPAIPRFAGRVLQIFRVQMCAAGFKGCSNNQGIVKTKIIVCFQV